MATALPNDTELCTCKVKQFLHIIMYNVFCTSDN